MVLESRTVKITITPSFVLSTVDESQGGYTHGPSSRRPTHNPYTHGERPRKHWTPNAKLRGARLETSRDRKGSAITNPNIRTGRPVGEPATCAKASKANVANVAASC